MLLLFVIAVLGGAVCFIHREEPVVAPLPAGPSPAAKQIPYVAPEKVKYRFQDHQRGPLPFAYTPPLEPAALADLLSDRIRLGWYRVDHIIPIIAQDRQPEPSAPALRDQYWHPKKRSYPNLLAAFSKELPAALEQPKPAAGMINTARAVAVTLDALTAAALAQAQLRLAAAKDLPRALDCLAGAYWLHRDFDELESLLAAGLEFRPTAANGGRVPRELQAILAAAATAEPLPALQLAVIRGDAKTARAALGSVRTAKHRQRFLPLVERLEEGLQAGLDDKGRKQLAIHFAELRRHLEDVQLPLKKRFAGWPIERLEEQLLWCTRATGFYSDPTTDVLAYLVEERDYRGVGIPSGAALCAGKRLIDRREPFRALPMFLLTQKLGYLSEAARFDADGPDGMVLFNGFEAPIYFVQTIESHPELRAYVKEHDELYQVAMQMYHYSEKHCVDTNSAGIAGRPGYYELALSIRWPFSLHAGHPEDAVPEIMQAMRTGPTKGVRFEAADCLATYYLYKTREYNKAADLFRRLALGRIDGVLNEYALEMFLVTAREAGSKALEQEAIELATAMLEGDAREQLSPESRGRLRKLRAELQNPDRGKDKWPPTNLKDIMKHVVNKEVVENRMQQGEKQP